ncbi:MAG: hypothetical protein R3198_04760 [Marinobacter sp.]|nr:hypothetical protein [Marinobacter sp.]
MTIKITTTIGFTACILAATPAWSGMLEAAGLTESTETSEPTLQPGDPLDGRYILTLDSSIPDILGLADLQASVESLLLAVGGGDILHLYRTAMTGAAVSLSE